MGNRGNDHEGCECVYFAQAKDCRIVTSYEGSIKEIRDKIDRIGEEDD